MDTWEQIAAERATLARALGILPESAWDRPSLCEGWTIRQVVGHLIATAAMTPPRFFVKLIGSGFNFGKLVDRQITEVVEGRSTAELVALYHTKINTRTAPPGPAMSWLGETIVHGEDIFRALGEYHEHPIANVIAVADFYAGSNLLIGARKRIAGVTLRATDTDWTRGAGSTAGGPEVVGPMLALLLALSGRTVALDDLSGDGVAVLRARA
jgi:uncharacterized protein (TIGR03083 family)